jgi:hypothetical protein
MRKQRKAEEQEHKALDAKQWREKTLAEGRKKVSKAAAAQQAQQVSRLLSSCVQPKAEALWKHR